MTRTSRLLMLGIASFSLTFLVGYAFADPLPTLPSVTGDPIGAASGVWTFIEHYGPLWGGVLAMYLVTGPLLAKAEADHWTWLATGRRNAYAHGVVNVLGAVAIGHWAGQTWQAIGMSVLMSVFLLVHPAPANQIASPARNTEGGRFTPDMSIALALVGLGVALLSFVFAGCGPTTKRLEADAATCLKAEVSTAAADLVVDVERILRNGSPGWKDELNAIEAQGKAHGGSALLCAVQAAIAELAGKASATVGTGTTAASPEAAGAARGREYLAGKGL